MITNLSDLGIIGVFTTFLSFLPFLPSFPFLLLFFLFSFFFFIIFVFIFCCFYVVFCFLVSVMITCLVLVIYLNLIGKFFFPQNRQDTANMTILENIFAIIVTHDNIERKSELLLKQWWRVIGFSRKVESRKLHVNNCILKKWRPTFFKRTKRFRSSYIDDFSAY